MMFYERASIPAIEHDPGLGAHTQTALENRSYYPERVGR